MKGVGDILENNPAAFQKMAIFGESASFHLQTITKSSSSVCVSTLPRVSVRECALANASFEINTPLLCGVIITKPST